MVICIPISWYLPLSWFEYSANARKKQNLFFNNYLMHRLEQPDKQLLSDFLTENMKKRWITSVQLAAKVGVPVTTLKSWFQRNSFPLDVIERLVEGAGVRINNIDDLRNTTTFKIARQTSPYSPWDQAIESVDESLIYELSRYPTKTRIIWAAMIGKTLWYAGLGGWVIHVPFSTEEPMAQTVARVLASLDRNNQTIVRANTLSIFNALKRMTSTKTWELVVFDGMEHLDIPSRRIIVESILGLTEDDARIAYTSFGDNKWTFEEDQLASQSAPYMFRPYSTSYLYRYIPFFLKLSKGNNLTQRIILELAEFNFHRKLVHDFLESCNNPQNEDEAITVAKNSTLEKLKWLLTWPYSRCSQILREVSYQDSNIDGEDCIEYDYVWRLNWTDIEYLISTTLFSFRNNRLYTTRLIDQSMNDTFKW